MAAVVILTVCAEGGDEGDWDNVVLKTAVELIFGSAVEAIFVSAYSHILASNETHTGWMQSSS